MAIIDKILFIILIGSLILGMCIWGFENYLVSAGLAFAAILLLRFGSILNIIPLFLGAYIAGKPFWFAWVIGLILMTFTWSIED